MSTGVAGVCMSAVVHCLLCRVAAAAAAAAACCCWLAMERSMKSMHDVNYTKDVKIMILAIIIFNTLQYLNVRRS